MADHQNDQGSWSGSNYSSSSSITSFIIHDFIVKIILTLIIGTSPDLTLGIDVMGGECTSVNWMVLAVKSWKFVGLICHCKSGKGCAAVENNKKLKPNKTTPHPPKQKTQQQQHTQAVRHKTKNQQQNT